MDETDSDRQASLVRERLVLRERIAQDLAWLGAWEFRLTPRPLTKIRRRWRWKDTEANDRRRDHNWNAEELRKSVGPDFERRRRVLEKRQAHLRVIDAKISELAQRAVTTPSKGIRSHYA